MTGMMEYGRPDGFVLQDPGRSLELWACSPYGILRFFRIAGTCPDGLCRDGEPVAGNGGNPGTAGVTK